ncbi:MAG: DNA replication/repair protein RecF [Prevotella sp.]|nr:DNA replication/repair protein RecF [Prevotella sp.]
MILKTLTIVNFKNIGMATVEWSPKMNCLVGQNGVGKTNILDAIYYLSFCRSVSNPIDSQLIKHDEPYFMIEGRYETEEGEQEVVSCALKKGVKKRFKRNDKEYRKLADHIGLIPIVFVSPADTWLIEGQSEDRRRFMDMVISQYDRLYMDALVRYAKALQQRNTMLKAEMEPDPALMDILEEQMASEGERIYSARRAFLEEFTPVFRTYLNEIASSKDNVAIEYVSHCQRGPLLEVIRRDRMKDRVVGYSLHGVHRDDLNFTINGRQLKKEGSQGQNKTFSIALKLAQFEFLKRTASHTTPILLLDDIFDKLDAERVARIVDIVLGDNFGQTFITDTDRSHLEDILHNYCYDYRIFNVADGEISIHNSSNHCSHV